MRSLCLNLYSLENGAICFDLLSLEDAADMFICIEP